jgi:hypothetical protein
MKNLPNSRISGRASSTARAALPSPAGPGTVRP